MNDPRLSFRLIPLVAGFVACFVFPALSSATMMDISTNSTSTALVGDIPFKDLPNNNPTSNFNALLSNVSRYETYAGTNLPDPVYAGYGDYSPGTVSLTGFDYAVLHYGSGKGGSSGGGIVFYYLNGLTGNYAFPTKGLGPNGYGGLSSIRLFTGGPTTPVPEGGAAVNLMGIALTGVALFRRFIFA